MFAIKFLTLSLSIHVALFAVQPIQAATQQAASQPAAAQPQSAKQEALAWISAYRKVQMIFHAKEVVRLEDELKKGSEEQAKKWLEATKRNREVLDSSRWKTTQKWLRDFLPVQGIYSDKEISDIRTEVQEIFRESVKAGNTEKFVDRLMKVEQKRLKRKGAASTTAALQARDSFLIQAQKEAQARAAKSLSRSTASTSRSTSRPPARNVRRPTVL